MKNYKKDLAAFVRSNIDGYEERFQLALNKMDRLRCPLRMADEELFNDIVNAIEDWCDDHEVALDFFDDEEDIVEEIIFTEV